MSPVRSRLAAALLVLIACVCGSPAQSQDKPTAPPPAEKAAPPVPEPGSATPPFAPDTPEIRAEILKDLYTHLSQAKDSDTAAAIAGQIERLWFVSGSDTVDLLMQRALAAMNEQNLELALKLLTAVTELQPDYAEGWNRRAFVYYRMNEIERSLGDMRRALALEPKHFRALENLAGILREAGKKKAALETLRKLVEIHPHLPNVRPLIEELTREVDGQGI